MGYELTQDLGTVSQHDRASTRTSTRGRAPSKAALWTGRVSSGLSVAFLAFDGIMKLPGFKFIIEASAQAFLQVINRIAVRRQVKEESPQAEPVGAV